MARIGTAHVEIKPVLNEDALDALCRRVEQAVAQAVANGLEGKPAQTEADTE